MIMFHANIWRLQKISIHFFLFRVVMGLAADGPIKSLLYYLLFVLLWIGKVIDRGDWLVQELRVAKEMAVNFSCLDSCIDFVQIVD